MADVEISNLPAATKLGVADFFAVVQGGTTKRAPIDLLPFLTGKIALVDGVNGVDAGQAVGETPFATIAAAITAANAAGGIGLIDIGPGVFTENSGLTGPDGWAIVGFPGLTKITSNLSDTTHAVLRPGQDGYYADLIVECTGASSSPIGIMSADTAATGSVFQRVKTIGLIDGFKVDKTGTNNFKAYDCISVTGPTGGTVDAVNSASGTNDLEFWNCEFTTIGNSSTFSSPRGVVASSGTVRLFNCKISTSAAGSSGNNQPLVASGGTIEAHNIRISRDTTGSAGVAADLTQTSGTLKVGNGVVRDDGLALKTSGTITYLSTTSGRALTIVTSTVDQTATTETAHLSTPSLPANFCQPGTTFRITAWGNMDHGTAAITFTPRLRWGGTGGVQLIATPTVVGDTTSRTNRSWKLEAYVTIRSIGASGTAMCVLGVENHVGAAYAADEADSGATAVTIDTTAAKTLDLTWALSAATGTPHVRTLGGSIELVKG